MNGVYDFIDLPESLEVEKNPTSKLSLPVYKKHVLDVHYKVNDKGETEYNKLAPPLPFAKSNVFKANIVHWRRLTGANDPDDSCKIVYEVTFDVKDSNFKFKAGDTIGVIPENDENEVELIISHLGLKEQADLPYTLSVRSGLNGKIPAHIPVKSTLRHVLKRCVDLRVVLKKLFLLALSNYTEDERDRLTLQYFCSAEGAQYYQQYVLNNGKSNTLSITELFTIFKSCKPPIEVLLAHLPRLLPRPYSIVNSGLKDSNVLKLCFSVLPPSLRKGLTTGWLENMILKDDFTDKFRSLQIESNGGIENEKVPIYLRINTGFSLPEINKNPLVLIAVGTAVSPFIGFLEELEIIKTSNTNVTDDVWLFFGCRDPKLDHIYENELNGFRTRRVLKKLHVAFSHSKNGERHVQDLLENNSRELTNLMESNASIFVCGDIETFANTIKGTLKLCLLKGGKTEDEASKIISEMVKEKRYIVDSWA